MQGGSIMPTNTQFSITMEDRPGALGNVCQSLADRGVNILAFHTTNSEGKALVRMVVDNPTTAKTALDSAKVKYTEAQVAQAKLPHRPGELARAAARLGQGNININHAYCGFEASTNTPLVIFDVANVGRAVTILDEAASAAKGA
jgi:hypothetical protein